MQQLFWFSVLKDAQPRTVSGVRAKVRFYVEGQISVHYIDKFADRLTLVTYGWDSDHSLTRIKRLV